MGMTEASLLLLACAITACGAGPHHEPPHRGPAPATAVTSCPFLPGSYPTSYPVLTKPDLDARAAAFRARNGGTWSTVSMDELGAVNIVVGDGAGLVQDEQPEATARERAAWLALLRANPDAFGTAGCTLALTDTGDGASFRITGDPARGAAGFISFEKLHSTEGGVPHYVVDVVGHLVRTVAIPARRIDDAAARTALVGRHYAVYVPPAPGPVSDPPGSGLPAQDRCQAPGQPGCASARELVVAPGDVTVTEQVQCVSTTTSLAVQRVLRLDLAAAGAGGPTTPAQITPRDGAPRPPVFVDAVTGELVAGFVQDCH